MRFSLALLLNSVLPWVPNNSYSGWPFFCQISVIVEHKYLQNLRSHYVPFSMDLLSQWSFTLAQELSKDWYLCLVWLHHGPVVQTLFWNGFAISFYQILAIDWSLLYFLSLFVFCSRSNPPFKSMNLWLDFLKLLAQILLNLFLNPVQTSSLKLSNLRDLPEIYSQGALILRVNDEKINPPLLFDWKSMP